MPLALHLRQHRHQRPLQRRIDRAHALGHEARLQQAPQPHDQVGGSPRSRCRRGGSRPGRTRPACGPCRPRPGTRSAHGRDGASRARRARGRRARHRARRTSASRRRTAPARCRAVCRTTMSFLMSCPSLSTLAVLEQRLEPRQRFRRRDLAGRQAALGEQVVGGAMAERHVAGLVRPQRHGDADDLGLHRVGRGRSQRHRHEAVARRLGNPVVERRDQARSCDSARAATSALAASVRRAATSTSGESCASRVPPSFWRASKGRGAANRSRVCGTLDLRLGLEHLVGRRRQSPWRASRASGGIAIASMPRTFGDAPDQVGELHRFERKRSAASDRSPSRHEAPSRQSRSMRRSPRRRSRRAAPAACDMPRLLGELDQRLRGASPA